MPLVAAAHLGWLIDAFRADGHAPVCVPVNDGRRGNPVLWPARLFPSLMRIGGDVGGRAVLGSAAERIVEVAMPDAAVLIDIDDAERLAALTAARGNAPID